MAVASLFNASGAGSALQRVLACDDIVPGSDTSYELCKIIYLFHPLGQKLAEAPIKMAMRLPRTIKVTGGPEDDLVKAFDDQWKRDNCHQNIRNMAVLARVYGIASIAVLEKGIDPSQPVKFDKLADQDISFNVLDPLNTAGSLVLDQNPNSMEFQKHVGISVAGKPYHRSRSVTLINEFPVYLDYNSAAFGFSGRSVYQRALYPLKSFINTMDADNMVARKVGLLVATIKAAGSIVDSIMNAAASFKRRLLKVAETDNVISINEGESVDSLNLTNLDGPLALVRRNIIENTATAADMPAKILLQETFAEGFGEGVEDANYVNDYLDEMRVWMDPAYKYLDKTTMIRAWNPRFFKSLQDKYGDDLGSKSYEECFYQWKNSFEAQWPGLTREPESIKLQSEEMKIQGILAVFTTLAPMLDPENMAQTVQWLQGNLNNLKLTFSNELDLDVEMLTQYAAEQAQKRQEMEEAAANEPKTDSSALATYMARHSSKDTNSASKIARIEKYIGKHPRLVK